MVKSKPTQVVILIFIEAQKIFVEKRSLNKFRSDQYLIPGGEVEENELENLELTLKREAMEELGVVPLDFTPLPLSEEILGINGQILKPFIIKKWEGTLPESILDKGNQTLWIEIKELLKSPFKPSKLIVQALDKYLSQKK